VERGRRLAGTRRGTRWVLGRGDQATGQRRLRHRFLSQPPPSLSSPPRYVLAWIWATAMGLATDGSGRGGWELHRRQPYQDLPSAWWLGASTPVAVLGSAMGPE
jgi:hypothetical protein